MGVGLLMEAWILAMKAILDQGVDLYNARAGDAAKMLRFVAVMRYLVDHLFQAGAIGRARGWLNDWIRTENQPHAYALGNDQARIYSSELSWVENRSCEALKYMRSVVTGDADRYANLFAITAISDTGRVSVMDLEGKVLVEFGFAEVLQETNEWFRFLQGSSAHPQAGSLQAMKNRWIKFGLLRALPQASYQKEDWKEMSEQEMLAKITGPLEPEGQGIRPEEGRLNMIFDKLTGLEEMLRAIELQRLAQHRELMAVLRERRPFNSPRGSRMDQDQEPDILAVSDSEMEQAPGAGS